MIKVRLEKLNLDDFTQHLFDQLGMSDWPLACRDKGRKVLEIMYSILKNKKRDQGTSFIYHPIDVALMLINKFNVKDPRIIMVALLHDVVEQDMVAAERNITEKLGKSYLKDVWKLTKEYIAFGRVKEIDDDQKYFKKIRRAGNDLFIVKLSDRISNLKELSECGDPSKIKKYLSDLDTFYIPLAVVKSKYNQRIKKLLSNILEERMRF